MEREKTIMYLMDYLPRLHRKLFKNSMKMDSQNFTRHQFMLLYTLDHFGEKPMKFFGEKLTISKPNLSTLVDKMVEEKLIERVSDEIDRRRVKIRISNNGKNVLKEHGDVLKKHLFKRVSVLSDSDIKSINESFDNIQTILEKIQE